MAHARRIGVLLLAGATLGLQPASLTAPFLPTCCAAFAHGAGGSGGGNGGTGAGGIATDGNAGQQGPAHGDTQGDAAAPSPGLQGRPHAALGALNAAHASHTAFAHAAPGSEVGRIAAYYHTMLVALAMPASTQAQVVAARDQTIANVRATQLAPAANKSLSPSVVARVDHLLGQPVTAPSLGAVR